MRRVRVRLRAIVSLSVVFALCFTLAGIQPAYAGNETVQNALDTAMTIYNNSFEGWLSASAHDGVDMAQNLDIGDDQTAYFYIEVTGPGVLSWWLKTDTESSWDEFRLYDNNVAQPAYERSGLNPWTRHTYSVAAGTHQIRFAYEKDFSVSTGADAVYVDELVFATEPPSGRVDGAHLSGNAVPLVPTNPEAQAQSGFSVGISDNVLAVGSAWDDTGQTNAGSATIYRRTGGTWAADQLITAPDETASAFLGTDLALDSGILAVAAPIPAKIYVYQDNGSDFLPYGATITAPAGASDFGGSVAISNGTIVTGARYAGTDFQGRAFVYTYSGGAWTLQQTLDAPDAGSRDFFGASVDIEGDRLIVGAPGHDHAGEPGGAAYVYTRSGSTWTLESELHAPGGTASTVENDGDFGWSVGISNGTVVAGARFRRLVYVHTRPDGVWALTDVLRRPTEPAGSSEFGGHVAIDGDTILSGDPYYDLAHGGTVFAFQRSNGYFFDLVEQLHSSVPSVYGAFGDSVAIDGPQFAVGERLWTGPAGSNQGRAVVYDGAYYRVAEGGTLNVVPAMGITANDISPSGMWIHPAGYTSPADGTMTLYAMGSFDYTAASPSPAEVPFTYMLTDDVFPAVGPINAYITVAPAPAGEPVFNNGDYYTNTTAVPMTVDLANVRLFRTKIDDGAWSPWQWRGSQTSTNVQLGPVSDAVHRIWTEFMGPGGQRAFHEDVFLDTGDPVPVIGAHGVLTAGGTVHVSATDAGSGVDRICYQVEGSPEVWVDADHAEVPFPAAGVFDMSLKAVDLAGNESALVTDEITVVTPSEAYVRFPGSDRYNTAIMASQSAYLTGSCDAVIIATGNNYPDALAAAGLGGAVEAPVLLVNPAKARAEVITEIKRLTQGHPSFKLYIMGGTAAVPAATESWLKSSLTGESVERFAGTDRYHTARLVAARMKALLGGSFGTKALLVPGLDFTDGLIVGPAAYSAKAPILLTRPQSDWELAGALQQLGTTQLVLCGSTAALPAASAETYLKGAVSGLTTARATSSADPYVRSTEAAEYFATPANGFGLTWNGVGIATAERYPDGLAAGCIEGRSMTPLLLTRVSSLPASVGAKLAAHQNTIAGVRLYGGTMAVSAATETAIKNALK